MDKRLYFALGILLVAIVAFYVVFSLIPGQKQGDASISSYEECVAAGYPSMESYPEQCRTADGKHFVRVLPDNELAGIISPITVRGMITCLPHWNTSGPQTLECAIGLQGETGQFYALRESDSTANQIFSIPMDVMIEVSGPYVPGSIEKYQTVGTIVVESYKIVE